MALIDRATAFWRLGDSLSSNHLLDALGRGNDLTPFLRPAPVMHDFRMGSNNAGSQQFVGSLAKWGKWDRLLDSTEKSALFGGGTAPEPWPFNTTTSLRDAVVYYPLNEATGSTTYADATGRGNSLIAKGATVQVSALGGSATSFSSGTSLLRSYTADLQTGNFPWTICGWVNLTQPQPGNQSIFWGQWDITETTYGTGTSATRYFTSGTNLYYQVGGDSFAIDGGSPIQLGQNPVIPSTGTSPVGGNWYFLLAEYDLLANTMYYAMNNGTRKSVGPIQQPTPVAGKIGAASNFILNQDFSFGSSPSTGVIGWDSPPPANGNCHAYLQRNSDVSFGNNPFTVWGWVNLKSPAPGGIQTLLGIYYSGLNQCEYIVQYSQGSLYWVLGNNSGATANYISASMTAGVWHLFVCWYDKAGNSLNISIDNGTPVSGTLQSTPPETLYGKRRFTIGAACGGEQFQGALNAVGIASGIPDSNDRATLWNGGNGIVLGNARRKRTSDTGQYPGYLWT